MIYLQHPSKLDYNPLHGSDVEQHGNEEVEEVDDGQDFEQEDELHRAAVVHLTDKWIERYSRKFTPSITPSSFNFPFLPSFNLYPPPLLYLLHDLPGCPVGQEGQEGLLVHQVPEHEAGTGVRKLKEYGHLYKQLVSAKLNPNRVCSKVVLLTCYQIGAH